MDFQSAMETFAEAWVAANTKPPESQHNGNPQSEALALTTGARGGRSLAPTPDPPPSPRIVASDPSPPPSYEEKSTPGKSLPVHCVVETVWSVQEWKCGGARSPRKTGALEVDSYVIIPVNTAFQDLVHVALHRLGYSKDNAAAAKGSVVIKNWKPLSFDKVAESPLMTVGDILGELSTIATLRIQIFRARPSSLSDMKDKLLRLLLVQSHSMLMSSGCPLDELVRGSQGGPGQGGGEPNDETRRKFEHWWSVQLGQQARASMRHLHWYSPPPPVVEMDRKPADKPPDEHVHPALQTVQNQYPTQKTRMRTSFDPELELPKLQRWFCENQHPSRQQIQQYVKELNSLDSRRGRKPLDVNNVVYWFKNARAAQKRAEVRSLAPGIHLSLNGYNSNSQSPSDTGLMPKSPGSTNHDDDEDDDDGDLERASSPTAPLSLTTNRNSEARSPVSSKDPASPAHHLHHHADGIKQEPADDDHNRTSDNASDSQNNNSKNNNNNNNPKEEQQDMSDDEEEDMDDGTSECEDGGGGKDDSKSDARMGACLVGGGGGDSVGRSPASGFPMVPNSMLSQSIMYMSHYIPGLAPGPHPAAPQGLNLSALADERRKRNRTFIDPVSEVPRLEQWFAINTHPSHNLILKYTDDLNRMPYRQKFPPLEPKNVQFWFKNRRAKCKRLKMSLFESSAASLPSQASYHHHLSAALSDPYQSSKL